jgi:HEAT repeat protein
MTAQVTLDQPQAKKPRSRKIYVLWAIALTLLLALGLLCWAVLLPPQGVRDVVVATHRDYDRRKEFGGGLGGDEEAAFLDEGVRQLGGTLAAARLLGQYLECPALVAPYRHVAIGLLGRCGEPGVPVLADQLTSSNALCRRWAARSLCWLGPKAQPATTALIKALGDRDESVRAHAASAIAKIGPSAVSAVPALKKIFEGPPAYEVRAVYEYPTLWTLMERGNAVWALSQIAPNDPRVRQVLTKALKDRSDVVKSTALRAVERIGPEARGLAPLVRGLFQDANRYVRIRAATAHWRLTGKKDEAVACLRRSLQDPNKELVETIGEIGVAEHLIPELTLALSTARDSWVLGSIAIVLGDLGPKARAAIPALEKLEAGNIGTIPSGAATKALKKIKAAQEKDQPK